MHCSDTFTVSNSNGRCRQCFGRQIIQGNSEGRPLHFAIREFAIYREQRKECHQCNEYAIRCTDAHTQRSHTFLLEFIQITKPIVTATEQLSKSNCYYATFLPTTYTIDHSFEKMLVEEFDYCRPLLQAMRAGLKRRFEYCFNLEDKQCRAAVLAKSTHPFFKTRWLPPKMQKTKVLWRL